mmetsp:Transcript_41732/g.132749  ORF Transcript_41732/g.132749 Transcript_41732/m.132749 type:complete len:241 (+) Transcript_41732:149-871(+)
MAASAALTFPVGAPADMPRPTQAVTAAPARPVREADRTLGHGCTQEFWDTDPWPSALPDGRDGMLLPAQLQTSNSKPHCCGRRESRKVPPHGLHPASPAYHPCICVVGPTGASWRCRGTLVGAGARCRRRGTLVGACAGRGGILNVGDAHAVAVGGLEARGRARIPAAPAAAVAAVAAHAGAGPVAAGRPERRGRGREQQQGRQAERMLSAWRRHRTGGGSGAGESRVAGGSRTPWAKMA